MASLQEKLKLNNKQGTVSSEEMANLSAKAGRSVPTTPLEGSVVGGNKDQAKMMGTRQSLQSTLSMAGTGQDLQTRKRQEQVRRDATAGEQQSMEQADTLANLGSLGERVQSLTQSMINQNTGDAAALQLSEAGLEQDSETQGLIQELANAAPGSQEALDATLALNQKLGRDQETQLSSEELLANFGSASESVAGQAAANIGDQILVSDIDLTELGFTDSTELASVLGIDPAVLEGETLQSLQQKVDAKLEEEYSRISDLEAQANDPARSATERAQARKELRAMGAVGVRETEGDVEELADQIANADTIDYLGEEYKVEELLDDEVISGLAAKFLDDSGLTTDEWKDQFREQNSDLAGWLEENRDSLSQSLEGIDETVMEFADIQNSNKALKQTSTGEELSDELASIIIPGYNELSAERLETNPIIDILKGQDTAASNNLKVALDSLAEVDSTLVQEMTGLTEDEIKQLGATENTPEWKQFLQANKDAKAVEQIPEDDPIRFFSEMFGKTVGPEEVSSELREAVLRQRSGLFGESPMGEFLDQMTDDSGRLIMDLPTLASKLRNNVGKSSLRQFLTNPGSVVSLSDKLARTATTNKAVDPTGLYEKVKDVFANDGKLGRNEHSMIAVDDIEEVLNSNLPMDKGVRPLLINKYSRTYSRPELAKSMKAEGLIPSSKIGKKSNFEDVQATVNRLKAMKKEKTGVKGEAMAKAIDKELGKIERRWKRTRPVLGEGATVGSAGDFSAYFEQLEM